MGLYGYTVAPEQKTDSLNMKSSIKRAGRDIAMLQGTKYVPDLSDEERNIYRQELKDRRFDLSNAEYDIFMDLEDEYLKNEPTLMDTFKDIGNKIKGLF